MKTKRVKQYFRLALLLSLMPVLVGSKCAVLFSSGNDDDDDEKEEKFAVVTSNGTLGSPPIAGVHYRSGTTRGVTGSEGEYKYTEDSPVQFSIGDIALGKAVDGKSITTIADLAGAAEDDSPKEINIRRLLMALDSTPEDESITIPDQVSALALRSNEDLQYAIEYLDFSDEIRFANSASQLVSVLTRDYPFTAVLPDEIHLP